MNVVLAFLGIFAFFVILNCPIIYAIIATVLDYVEVWSYTDSSRFDRLKTLRGH